MAFTTNKKVITQFHWTETSYPITTTQNQSIWTEKVETIDLLKLNFFYLRSKRDSLTLLTNSRRNWDFRNFSILLPISFDIFLSVLFAMHTSSVSILSRSFFFVRGSSPLRNLMICKCTLRFFPLLCFALILFLVFFSVFCLFSLYVFISPYRSLLLDLTIFGCGHWTHLNWIQNGHWWYNNEVAQKIKKIPTIATKKSKH